MALNELINNIGRHCRGGCFSGMLFRLNLSIFSDDGNLSLKVKTRVVLVIHLYFYFQVTHWRIYLIIFAIAIKPDQKCYKMINRTPIARNLRKF